MSFLEKELQSWTKAQVHEWLLTKVKINPTYADKFLDEDVEGEYLVEFKKQDILDLKIKHGPGVKITFYLGILKQGLKYKTQYPVYVENWTKEQVCAWLLQHVKIYEKYTLRFLEEDVSGDCLVCFTKQDLLDIDVKGGPAVKILKELELLKSKPEPALEISAFTNPPQRDNPPCFRSQPILSPPSITKQPSTNDSKELQTRVEPTPQAKAANRILSKTNLPQQSTPNEIRKTLENLSKSDLKKFIFNLNDDVMTYQNPIARIHLEDKDIVDIVDIMIRHFRSEEAWKVTINILEQLTCCDLVLKMKNKIGQVKQHCLSNEVSRRESNHGDKLKNLLTCGGNSLDNYDRFVLVVNKSNPKQVEYLQFLNKLKLFCVLDFDPQSVISGGLCHSYRESRVANLHSPSQFQGQTEIVIKNLNLYKQTSWVFCNGRHDLENEACLELDYKHWLKNTCKDVEYLVSFICKPEVLLHGRTLILFLLLSPVHSEKEPLFDTYKAFLKHIEEESLISICESESTYTNWSDLIQEKCECDISKQSVYELSLSEVNGTIMALGPFNHLSGRLLPSSDSSFVILKQRDEDLMTALDILCQNQCENVFDENSTEFHDFKIKVEEEFFRGGKVKWWNFYFCEKHKKPFIKREKYDDLMKMIRFQFKNAKSKCTLLNLFHHPGCGGTTLAMNLLWDLRKDFRCAVLKDNSLPKAEVAIQVKNLMMLESEKPFPVLLLVDDSKEIKNAQYLEKCVDQAVVEVCISKNIDSSQNCNIIILNCIRSHSPKEQYRQHSPTECQFIKASLTQKEQDDFQEKHEELKETHKKPENFYSFMIMKSNFDQTYVDDLVHNTLENFDFNTKNAQLFAYLALLNKYVEESEISVSLSEDFLGMKMIYWREDNVMERMKPYSNFLIIDTVEKRGGYRGIRILHNSIASTSLKELEKSYYIKVSEITMCMLQCDLFFKTGVVRDTLMLSIQRMLIERQRKKDGDERETFSPLIDKIHNQQGRQTVQDIFVKASSQFMLSASIPQALARYLYIKEHDFPEALKWAEKAKTIKENPYTADTVGQVFKNYLKSNLQSEKQSTTTNPEDLDKNVKLAINAFNAFRKAQELANTEDKPEEEISDEDSEDYPTKPSYNVYGYVGMLEIAFLVFDMFCRLPFFSEGDPLKKKYFQSFFKQKMTITSVYKEDNEINNRYVEIIEDHERFLLNLKTEVKELFEFFDCYFTYMKSSPSGEFDSKNRGTISNHFKTYVMLFCTTTEEKKMERDRNPKLTLKMEIEECRMYLEEIHADNFAGIFQYLDKDVAEIEIITEKYTFLQQNQQFVTNKQKVKEKINYILSSIILFLLKPKSKYVKTYRQLSALLLETLQDVGQMYPFPDPYYLALLLFWPTSRAPENTDIRTYVNAIRKSSRGHLSILFRKRSTVAHFYLGNGDGLGRLVPKPKLDECFAKKIRREREALAQLWRTGDIFKEKSIIHRLHRVKGTVELGEVFANYGKLKIPVRPAFLGGIRSGLSTEVVSFYLGFAIDGPLAYDIQYEN